MLEKRTLLRSAICGTVLATAAWLAPGSANAVTITNLSPDWVIVPGSVGPSGGIWGLPADLSGIGCEFENETSCEPTGNFMLSSSITSANAGSYYTILDDDGVTTSDIVTVANTGPSGNGQIRFYSDPDLGADLTGLTNLGILCTEDSAAGCVGSFDLTLADGSAVTVQPASDGEAVFDPFGFGFDTSDQVKFTCTTVGTCQLVQAPEPGSLSLFLTALVAGGFGLMWRGRIRRDNAA